MKDNVQSEHYLSCAVSKVYKIIVEAIIYYALGCILNCMILSNILIFIGIFSSLVSTCMLFKKTDTYKRYYTDLLATSLGVTGSPLIYEIYMANPLIIIISAFGTFVIFLTFMSMSKYLTNENMIIYGGFLFGSLLSLVVVEIGLLFFEKSITTEIICLILGLLLFCAYIAYDTKIMYINFKNLEEKPDHYYHAVNIFLNMINLFIKLSRLLMIILNKNKRK